MNQSLKLRNQQFNKIQSIKFYTKTENNYGATINSRARVDDGKYGKSAFVHHCTNVYSTFLCTIRREIQKLLRTVVRYNIHLYLLKSYSLGVHTRLQILSYSSECSLLSCSHFPHRLLGPWTSIDRIDTM